MAGVCWARLQARKRGLQAPELDIELANNVVQPRVETHAQTRTHKLVARCRGPLSTSSSGLRQKNAKLHKLAAPETAILTCCRLADPLSHLRIMTQPSGWDPWQVRDGSVAA